MSYKNSYWKKQHDLYRPRVRATAHPRPRPNPKSDEVEIRAIGGLERAGVKPGDPFSQELLRKMAHIDPRTIKKLIKAGKLKEIPIKGNKSARTLVMERKDALVINV